MKTATVVPQWLTLAAILCLPACGSDEALDDKYSAVPAPNELADDPPPPGLEALLNSDFRSEADKARDAGRKPAEVVAFLGIEPGMRVLDFMAGGGWYTEVLAIAVGPTGAVVSHNIRRALDMRDGANEKALSERLADGRLPNVSRLNKEIADLSAADGPFDAAITALNLHDIYYGGGQEAALRMLEKIYTMLKPGGILGVIDHQGIDGNDNASLHRMPRREAIRLAEIAGFELVEHSGILHIHSDDMTRHMRELPRGRTHRFLLKLRRPD